MEGGWEKVWYRPLGARKWGLLLTDAIPTQRTQPRSAQSLVWLLLASVPVLSEHPYRPQTPHFDVFHYYSIDSFFRIARVTDTKERGENNKEENTHQRKTM